MPYTDVQFQFPRKADGIDHVQVGAVSPQGGFGAAKCPGMEMHPWDTYLVRHPDLFRVRIDADRCRNTITFEGVDRIGNDLLANQQIQSTLRGWRIVVLRYQQNPFRFDVNGDPHHFRCRRDFHYKAAVDATAEDFDIPVQNVPSPTVEMDRDPVRTGNLRQDGGSCRFGVAPLPNLPEQCDVIDFDG